MSSSLESRTERFQVLAKKSENERVHNLHLLSDGPTCSNKAKARRKLILSQISAGSSIKRHVQHFSEAPEY